MESIIRACLVFVFLMIVFRAAGRRTLAQLTNFDFILLLIISEAIQNAMIGNDYSLTNGFLVVLTLVGLDIGLSLLKQRVPQVERWLDGLPMVLIDDGRPLYDRMRHCRVDMQDILAAARERHGLERMEQIKYAVLEASGGISIIRK
jgi:uncharacterized membrane protein YcaP (DUF421 family)